MEVACRFPPGERVSAELDDRDVVATGLERARERNRMLLQPAPLVCRRQQPHAHRRGSCANRMPSPGAAGRGIVVISAASAPRADFSRPEEKQISEGL